MSGRKAGVTNRATGQDCARAGKEAPARRYALVILARDGPIATPRPGSAAKAHAAAEELLEQVEWIRELHAWAAAHA